MELDMNDQGTNHRQSRADAIADGLLIDVTKQGATQAAFVCPIAMTRSAWFECVDISDDRSACDARLRNVLAMLRRVILDRPALGFERQSKREFRIFVPARNDEPMQLKALSERDADGRSSLTVMLSFEEGPLVTRQSAS